MPRPSAAALALAPAPSFTPARRELADALASVRATEAEIAKLPGLIEEAENEFHAASGALKVAERALERTKALAATPFVPAPRAPASFWSEQEHSDYQAEQAEPPMPLHEARAAVEKAAAAKQTADASIAFYRSRGEKLGQDLRFWRGAADRAFRAVVKGDPALSALAKEAKRLATRAASARLAFDSATGGDAMPSDSPFYRCLEPATFKEDFDGWALSRAWHDALDRLRDDASTPLPMPGADR